MAGALAGLVGTLVNGTKNIITGAVNIGTSALTGTVSAVLPAIKTIANSPAGAIMANNFTGGASTSALKDITQAMGGTTAARSSSSTTETTAPMDGISVPYKGWRRYLMCWYKLDDDGYLVDKDGNLVAKDADKVLDGIHIGVAAGIVLSLGVGIYFVGKSKRWW